MSEKNGACEHGAPPDMLCSFCGPMELGPNGVTMSDQTANPAWKEPASE